ncbi:MAG: DUF4382 domain-containing protein [Candidatus Sulfotelmatobacter sp.]
MRRTRLFFSLCLGLIFSFLTGCGQTPVSSTTPSPNAGVPVSLSMTDQPPNGVTVLFFQVGLTAASLTPASGSTSVSLLNNNTPIQVDVTQLQAISAFLSTANVPAGTYNSLSLTFANPTLVIFNASDQALASTCALDTVCQLTPQIDNSLTLTFSSMPFPLTVANSTPLGLLIDFHLNNVIQSDLSVNLGVTNGVTVKQLPPLPPVGPPQFGFLSGTVQSVNSSQNQFTLQTLFGRTFTVDVNSSTTYGNFPSSICATGAFSCLASGQVVTVQVASVQMDGTLLAAEVSYIQAGAQQVVQGNVVNLSSSNGSTVMSLLLHWCPPGNGSLPFGGIASVTVPSTATFSVDSDNFAIPTGLSFASASDLLVGQAVQVDVAAGSISSSGNPAHWAPPSVSFTANSVELEPSQITGTITAVSSSGSSFTITTFPHFFTPWFNPNWTPTQITVQTTSQTTYQGFSTDGFSGLTTNTEVSGLGWLFATPSGSTPSTMVAKTVLEQPDGFF